MPNTTNKEYVEHRIIDRLAGENPSLKDVADGVRMIYSSLWEKSALDQHIKEVHNSLCLKCPHRKKGGKMSGKLIALISALVTAVVGLAGAVVKLAMEIG